MCYEIWKRSLAYFRNYYLEVIFLKYYDVYLVLFFDSEEERKRNSFKMSNFNRKEMKIILTFSACGAYATVLEHSKKEKRKRRIWARDWLLKRK